MKQKLDYRKAEKAIETNEKCIITEGNVMLHCKTLRNKNLIMSRSYSVMYIAETWMCMI